MEGEALVLDMPSNIPRPSIKQVQAKLFCQRKNFAKKNRGWIPTRCALSDVSTRCAVDLMVSWADHARFFLRHVLLRNETSKWNYFKLSYAERAIWV